MDASEPHEFHDEEEGQGSTSPKSRFKSAGKSIVVMELPGELAKRDLLHAHFSQFGSVQSMSCSAKHHYAVIQFASHEEAVKAKTEGSEIDPQYAPLKMYLSNKTPASPSGSSSVFAPPPLKRKVSSSKGSLSTPQKLVNRARKMSSPEDKSGLLLDKRSANSLARMQAAKSQLRSNNIIPVKKRSVAVAPAGVSVKAINSALRSQLAEGIKAIKPRSVESSSVFNTDNMASNVFGTPGPVTSTVTSTKIAAIPTQENLLRLPAPFSQHTGRISPMKAPHDLLNFNPDTSEAQELFSKKYVTAEERYRALETRDKLLRARIPKVKVSVEFAKKLFGTCPDMCPEKERYMRQFQRQLTTYEVLTEHSDQVDHRKAIKVYSRSSADQEEPLPHELRPASTLKLTMDYLLHNIVSMQGLDEETLGDWYTFLWDRTRSIRKDITQQQLTSLESVGLMETCARFHIHCSSRLCELDVHAFEPKLNDENLMKCLQSLEHLYDDLRKQGVQCPNEPEFRAYQIMMHLNEGDVLSDAQQRPEWIFRSPLVQFALKVHNFVFQKNFVGFFRMVKSSAYMVSCILHRYFYQMRSGALRSLWKAHSCPPKAEVYMSMSGVQRMLGYGDQAAGFRFLCESHGIRCDAINDRLILNRRTFFTPQTRIVSRENNLIESKLKTSVAEAVNGTPLGPNPALTYVPHSSFNEEGFLMAGSIVGGARGEGLQQSPFVSAPSYPTVSAPSSFFKQPPVHMSGVHPAGPFFSNPPSTTASGVAGGPTPFGELSKNVFGQTASSIKATPFVSSSFGKKNIFGGPAPTLTTTATVTASVTTNSSSVFKPSQPSFAFGAPPQQQQQNLFGGFRVLQPPKPAPQPNPEEVRRQKEDVVQAKAKSSVHVLLDKYIKKQLDMLTQEALVAVEHDKRQKEQRKAKDQLVEQVFNVYAEKLINRGVVNIVKRTVQEEMYRSQILGDVCKAAADKVVTAIVQKRVTLITKGALWNHRVELVETTSKLKEIFDRIKLRMAVYKWIKFVDRKKRLRARDEERVMKDRLDFPAANPVHSSTEKLLSAFKGAHGRSPRLNKVDGKSAMQWMSIYDRFNSITEDYSKKLQSIAVDMDSSAHHSKANLENATPSHSSTITKARTDLNNYCWKRRWGNSENDDDHLDDEDSIEETHFKPIKHRKEDDGRRTNTSLDRDSSNSSSSLRSSSMSPDAKSLLDEMKKFMNEIKQEKEVNVDIPMDMFDTAETNTQTMTQYNNMEAASSSDMNFSIPDFGVPAVTSETDQVVQEAELRTPARTAALLDSLKMFLEETKEEKNKVFLLSSEELNFNL